jgi:pilus assembly protein Flp/PilA
VIEQAIATGFNIRRSVFLRAKGLFPDSGPSLRIAEPLGENRMNDLYLKLRVKFHCLVNGQEGQDLVEYALLMVIISLGLITSLHGIASAITTVFSNVSSSLA